MPIIGGSQFAENCLQSIFNSTYRKLEVIVISDNNESIEKLQQEGYDDKVIFIKSDEKSIIKARNIGIRHSSGELVAILDKKDITGKMRLELEVNKLRQRNEIGMVFCGMTFIDDFGNFQKGVKLFREFDINKFTGLMFEENRIDSISTTLIKKDVLEDVGIFDEELVYESEYDLFLRIASKYLVEYLDLPLLRFRMDKTLKPDENKVTEEREKILLKYDIVQIAQFLSKIYDNEEEFRISLGTILYQMGKKKEALKNFKKVLTLNSNNSGAYLILGNFYFSEGKFKEARNCYEELLEVNPDHAECRNNLGVLLYRQGKKDSSVEEFTKAKKLKKNYPDPLFNLKCTKNKKSYNILKITYL